MEVAGLDRKTITKLSTIAVFFIIILSTLSPAPPLRLTHTVAAQAYSEHYVFEINVLANGSAKVLITFRASGKGTSYIYLPKFTKYYINVKSGKVVWFKRNDLVELYFYTPRAFNYSGDVVMEISYLFPYASLMIGKDAWFMTPYINVTKSDLVRVIVHFPNFKTYTKAQPPPVKEQGSCLIFLLDYTDRLQTGGRVAVNYVLAEKIKEVEIVRETTRGTKLIFKCPPFYESLVDKIAKLLDKAQPYFEDIFGDFPKVLYLRFYLPKLIAGLGVYGYVRSEVIAKGENGPIYINLALIRFKEGFLEHTILHEYVHVALGRIGVAATRNTRWIHEGFAEYFAFEIAKKLNIPVEDLAETRERALDLYFKYVGSLGQLTEWPSGDMESLYYAASWYVIDYLAKKYGGPDFYKKVFAKIREKGGVNSTSDFINALAEVGGHEIYDLFKSWGFKFKRPRAPYLKIMSYVIIATVALVVIFVIIFYIARKKRREEAEEIYKICPYCGAVLDSRATYCYYCGRYLYSEEEKEEWKSNISQDSYTDY